MGLVVDYLAEAERLAGELATLRREFHREPELGNREFKTAERIERTLHECGIPARRILGTAVVGELVGKAPAPSVALRADMDALPLQEDSGVDFASTVPGVMHACGHDVHMTAALGAMKLLSAHRKDLSGRVIFLFQPDEEGDGGAQRMIEAGALDGVSAVFGAHVTPDLPLGHIGVRYGKFYAASDTFRVSVTGKSAHGAEREKGIDALSSAAEMVLELLKIPQTLRDASGETGVVSVGTFHSGTAGNIVADHAEFSGIIRTLGPEARRLTRGAFSSTVAAIAGKTGTRAEPYLHESYPGVVNEERMTRLVQETAFHLLGKERVQVIENPTLTTEDFGYFLQVCPGSFYHLGAGCSLPLHNPKFLPDDRAAVIGAALHASVVTNALEMLYQ
ncbi:MAG: amidohydrolase [Synergistaceae bacterium]|nr:amidohydrolase [Synergistaceae bacterium]